jgi:hypothetical protein
MCLSKGALTSALCSNNNGKHFLPDLDFIAKFSTCFPFLSGALMSKPFSTPGLLTFSALLTKKIFF